MMKKIAKLSKINYFRFLNFSFKETFNNHEMSLMRYDNFFLQEQVLKAQNYSALKKLKNVR